MKKADALIAAPNLFPGFHRRMGWSLNLMIFVANLVSGATMIRTLTATAFVIAGVIVGDSVALRSQGSPEPSPRNLDEFDLMFAELSNWGRWGSGDQLGTINLVTPAKGVRRPAS